MVQFLPTHVLPAAVPKAFGRMQDLIGQDVMYFKTAVYQQALLKMNVLERRYSYFGEQCRVRGEDAASSDF